jgi:DNA polymerase III sliding clamp (beta) subunit (PCNA family)
MVFLSGRTRAGISLQKEISPPIEELGKPQKWTELPDDFSNALSICGLSCGKDMTKPALTCIHLNKNIAESCDADFRLTRYLFKKDYFKTPILLPYTAAKEISQQSFDKFSATKGWIHFIHTESDLIFSTRVYETKYPKLDDFLKVKGTEIKIPKELGDCLDRCSIFAEAQVQRDELVQIDIDKNKICLKAQNERGWIKDSCKVEYKGKPISFLVNPRILRGSISNMDTAIVGDKNMKFKGENFDHLVALMIKE